MVSFDYIMPWITPEYLVLLSVRCSTFFEIRYPKQERSIPKFNETVDDADLSFVHESNILG